MLEQILQNKNLIFYVLTAEVLLLCIFQLRTNLLLKKMAKTPLKKKETTERIKEEVKNGKSEIPVVKFERPKTEEKKKPVELEKALENQQDIGEEEMVVLQELMTEFFG